MTQGRRAPTSRRPNRWSVEGLLVVGILVTAAGCSSAPSAVPTAAPTASTAPASAGPAGTAAVLTVAVSKMATSVAVIPDFCSGPAATDYPNRYTFTLTLADAAGADVTAADASVLLGKMAHLTLTGPPEAGTYDAPIATGPGGAGLTLIFPGGYCKPDGFSTFETLTIDGLPLAAQPDGTWRGTISVP